MWRVTPLSLIHILWSDFASCTAVKGENGPLSLKGKFNLCVLAVNGEGEPVYLEKMTHPVMEFSALDQERRVPGLGGDLRPEGRDARLSLIHI